MCQENNPLVIFNSLYSGIFDIHATKEFNDKETMVSKVKLYIEEKQLNMQLGEDLVYFKGVMDELYTAFLLDVKNAVVFYFTRDKYNHLYLLNYTLKRRIDTFRQIGIAPRTLTPMVYKYDAGVENHYTLVFKFKEALIMASSPTNNYYFSSEFDVNTCGDLVPFEPWSLFANLVKTKNFTETFKNNNINSEVREITIDSRFVKAGLSDSYEYIKVFTIGVDLGGVNDSVGSSVDETKKIIPSFSKVKSNKLTFEIKIPYKVRENQSKLSPLSDHGYFVVIAKLLAKLNQDWLEGNWDYFDVLYQKIKQIDLCEYFFDDVIKEGETLDDPKFLLDYFELN